MNCLLHNALNNVGHRIYWVCSVCHGSTALTHLFAEWDLYDTAHARYLNAEIIGSRYIVICAMGNHGIQVIYIVFKNTKKYTSAVRSANKDFGPKSSLQAACDTSIARVTECVPS